MERTKASVKVGAKAEFSYSKKKCVCQGRSRRCERWQVALLRCGNEPTLRRKREGWATLKFKSLAARLFVRVKCFAETIQKVPVFHFGAVCSVYVGPQDRIAFWIDQSDPCVAFGNLGFAAGIRGRGGGKLAYGYDPYMIAIVEAQDEIGLFARSGKIEAPPLAEFENQGILEFVKPGFILDEDGVSVGNRVRQRLRNGIRARGNQTTECDKNQASGPHRDVSPHVTSKAIGQGKTQ